MGEHRHMGDHFVIAEFVGFCILKDTIKDHEVAERPGFIDLYMLEFSLFIDQERFNLKRLEYTPAIGFEFSLFPYARGVGSFIFTANPIGCGRDGD